MKARAAFSSAWRCCALSAPWGRVTAGGAGVAGVAVEVGALVGLGSEVEAMAAGSGGDGSRLDGKRRRQDGGRCGRGAGGKQPADEQQQGQGRSFHNRLIVTNKSRKREPSLIFPG